MMMARRVTPEEIICMNQLYNQYGSYAAVARIVNRSAQTVARYIKLQGTPPIVKHTFKEAVREIK